METGKRQPSIARAIKVATFQDLRARFVGLIGEYRFHDTKHLFGLRPRVSGEAQMTESRSCPKPAFMFPLPTFKDLRNLEPHLRD